MGTSVNAQDDTDSKYVESVDALLEVLIERTFSPLLHNDFLYRFSKTYQKEQRALKVVHGYSRRVIGRKMGEFLKSRDNEEAPIDALGRKKKKAFLDLLLEYSSKDHSFTYEDICQEVDTFMFEVIWRNKKFNYWRKKYFSGTRYYSYINIIRIILTSS